MCKRGGDGFFGSQVLRSYYGDAVGREGNLLMELNAPGAVYVYILFHSFILATALQGRWELTEEKT